MSSVKNTSSSSSSSEKEVVGLVNWESYSSPYYTETHQRYRSHCRAFVEKEVLPYIDKWSQEGDIPQKFYQKCYEAGLYARWYPQQWGGTPWNNSFADSLDPFLTIIFNEEFARAGAAGLISAGWIHGLVVGPVLINGTSEQAEIMRSVIKAEKFASLCVSEPGAGSDVRNIQTTARQEGDYYIVNGEKYWITGGMKADYFLTACQVIEENEKKESKNDGKEPKILLLLIERQPGITTTRLPLQGHDCSATAYVVFRNVKVHKSMMVGKPKDGFKTTMKNFNQERFGIICLAVGLAKVCVEESVKYALSRKTFGKGLVEHQAIRHKLAEMSQRVLACHAYLENVAYRMKSNPLGSDPALVKDVALLKVNATRTLEYCAREASHIFGGRSYVKYGRAGKVERIYRDVRALAIYGGAEEIMLDLAVKQAKL